MKSYGQYCAVARALDVVGDRWTILIVRELLIAPKRYGELRAGLPGIATNLLAERLQHLLEAGVVERTDDRYELTARGRELEVVVDALFRWGLPLMVTGQGGDAFSADWLGPALCRLYDGVAADPPRTIDVAIGEDSLRLVVGPDGPRVGPVGDERADATISGTPDQVLGVLSGMLPIHEAGVHVRGGRVIRELARRRVPSGRSPG